MDPGYRRGLLKNTQLLKNRLYQFRFHFAEVSSDGFFAWLSLVPTQLGGYKYVQTLEHHAGRFGSLWLL